jgi:hypothetical protein
MNTKQAINEVKPGLKAMAQRIANAEVTFIGCLMTIGGINEDQARTVFTKYLKAKVLKLDPVIGTYRVKHGALLDAGCIQANALV